MIPFQYGHEIIECAVRPRPLPHYLWLRKLRQVDRRGLRVSSKGGTRLLDFWVFTPDSEPGTLISLRQKPQERTLPHTGEVCSQDLFEWVSPVLQLALANSLETHS